MTLWGTEGPWPPGPIEELSELFAGIQRRPAFRGHDDPGLHEVCLELDAWLADARDYAGRLRKDEWASLTEDLRLAVAARGPRVRRRDAGLDMVAGALHERIGRETVARGSLRTELQTARSALANRPAREDAFDDL